MVDLSWIYDDENENSKVFLSGSLYYFNKFVNEFTQTDVDRNILVKSDHYEYLKGSRYLLDSFIYCYDVNGTPKDFIEFILLKSQDNPLQVSTLLSKDLCEYMGITWDILYPYIEQIKEALTEQMSRREKDEVVLTYFEYMCENNDWALTDKQLKCLFEMYKQYHCKQYG